ncbi:MAG: SMC-Scp complex subunit ScpB [Candidatus Binataceae bacterium]
MEEERLKAILESLLFAAGEPVPVARLAAVLEGVAQKDIRKAIAEMAAAYAAGTRGIVLEEVAGGFQLRTPKEHAAYVRKLLSSKPPRLTRPMLETLAIIAYRQPITRPEIEQFRGVDCAAVLDTLLERRFIRIAGRKEAPGRPMLYATTDEFLETFGLKDLEHLPDLGELRDIEAAAEELRTAELRAAAEPEPSEPREVPASEAQTESPETAAPEPTPSADESSEENRD